MTTGILGLDIGGANLKAAHSNGATRSLPFALWKQPERLAIELARLCETMPAYHQIAITMTGELCDCFETKRIGVQAILESVRQFAGATPIRVWSLESRFLNFRQTMENPLRVAAANWLALGHLIAGRFPDENVLLIDSGSTTTDLLYLEQGMPKPRGLTDAERLDSGELVYTGIRRTPVCAVLGLDVAAEFFATMLDAYVLAGLLPEDPNDHDTADGRARTRAGSWARLARMRCADIESYSEAETLALAKRALRMQWQAVEKALARVVANRPSLDRFVVSGSGEILGRTVASVYAAKVTSLSEILGNDRSEAACAVAVATLAQESCDER